MARLDGHMHVYGVQGESGEFSKQLRVSSFRGGVIISQPPHSFHWLSLPVSFNERLDNLLFWCNSGQELYPFFWIDPMEKDVLEQIEKVCQQGIMGFKVICSQFFPGDPGSMAVFREIARRSKPILFHSGILLDGVPSSKYSRPVEFESLIEIQGLRFALSHIGWPWVDELIAVFGKFQRTSQQRLDQGVAMYIDITPGSPPAYRRENLIRLFTSGYEVEQRVFFGSNSSVNDYDSIAVKKWLELDGGVFDELGLSDRIQASIYSSNLKAFIGLPPKGSETVS